LGYQICAVCCGTKRLTEIHCPSDCPYLSSAPEHPPAVAVRRQQRDVESLVGVIRDFDEHQSQIFLMVATFLTRYEPPELHALLDVDFAEAANALASTFETASRGVIYEHRPASLPAQRLVAALKLTLDEYNGSTFERDAGVVLRRMAHASADVRVADASQPRAFLDLLGRMIRKGAEPDAPGQTPAEAPRLIVP
jgi:hypothetical protein